METRDGAPDADVVFVAGFGCGTFHFERNLAPLAAAAGCRTFAMDIAGQGKSWPVEVAPLNASGHSYDAELWVEQLSSFVDEVVRGGRKDGLAERRVFLVGNSLGGYLCAAAAERLARASAVEGVVLLNATPFWGSTAVLPEWLWRGALPVPRPLRSLVTSYWDFFRSEGNIARLLALVYARPDVTLSRGGGDGRAARDKEGADYAQLVADIRAPSEHPHALDAFCSILLSPALAAPPGTGKLTGAFDAALASLSSSGVKVVLLNGEEDPWVVPAWGRRAKRMVPGATLVEISPAGHCPHHEVRTNGAHAHACRQPSRPICVCAKCVTQMCVSSALACASSRAS